MMTLITLWTLLGSHLLVWVGSAVVVVEAPARSKHGKQAAARLATGAIFIGMITFSLVEQYS